MSATRSQVIKFYGFAYNVRMSRWLLVFLLAAVSFLALAADRPGDAIIAEIEAMKWPHWDATKEKDKVYRATYMKAASEHTKKKNALILNLYQVDPAHPRVPELMILRWDQFESGTIVDGANYEKRVLADIDSILSKNPAPKIVEAGEYARAVKRLDRMQNFHEDPSEIALKFAASYPRGQYT